MSFQNFANELYIKTFDSSETPGLGSFSVVTSGELQYIRSIIYINDVTSLGGSEQIRLKIYSDQALNNLLYTSDYSSLSDIADIGTSNWLGYIRITFNRENINPNLTYYVAAETINYTRNADAFYIGLAYDFPFPIYDNAQDLFYNHPLAMQIFTYQDRV